MRSWARRRIEHAPGWPRPAHNPARAHRASIHFGTTDSRLVHAATLLPPGWPGLQANVLQFDEIDDAQRVFALIRDAQRRAVGAQ